ncbi:helix-turn-helix domain-containing protein [Undibacterium sp. TJN19]|uniref:helix-turn-helix domain-containing protein n=1 Tax=Undibacterium sp. TJN19 TaxID=3413055 RepID=UPI003BEFBFFF
MQQLNNSKKPAMKPLLAKEKPQDWHRADIKAELEKAGWTLRKLALANGYVAGVMCHPLNQQYPKAEAIIAKAIGVQPQTIWPSRYNQDGTPKKQATSRERAVYIKPARQKFNTPIAQCNVEVFSRN